MRPSVAVRENTDRIRAIIARYPVRNARIFGSAARGDDREGSDLDLLVEPTDGTTLFDLAGLKLELEKLLEFLSILPRQGRYGLVWPGELPMI